MPFFVDDGRATHQGRESPVVIFDAHGRGALAPLDDDLDLPVLLLLRLQDAAQRADAVNLFGRRLVHAGVVLRGEEDRAVTGQRFFERADRAGATDLESDFGKRKNDDVADRHHRITREV